MVDGGYQLRARRGGRTRSAGVTLIELVTALAVLAVLVALAVPNFNDASLSGRLNGFANSLAGSAQLARGEAIKRNATIRLCGSTDGANCDTSDWEQGWIVVTEDDNTVLEAHDALPDEFRVTSSEGGEHRFLGSVVGTDAGTLTVCRASPVGSEERVVTISGTGAAYVTITTAGSCS